jgi:hypothetical protein
VSCREADTDTLQLQHDDPLGGHAAFREHKRRAAISQAGVFASVTIAVLILGKSAQLEMPLPGRTLNAKHSYSNRASFQTSSRPDE